MEVKNILFFSRYYYPHIGGVEKQVGELGRHLVNLGYKVSVITEKFSDDLKESDVVGGIRVFRFKPLKIKYLGLLWIWWWIFRHKELIGASDVIHAHSVYIWYWPFRFIFFRKPSYVTFHGWEGVYPIPLKNILIRKLDTLLAKRNIAISDYIEKYYHIRADKLMYTSVDLPKTKVNYKLIKSNKNLLYVGRLDEDTGLDLILSSLKYLKNFQLSVNFCGDGKLRQKCEKYGSVHGFTDPNEYYKKAFICLSPGHTSILEAFAFKCLVVTTYNNPLKKDYLLMTPFKNWIVVEKTPEKMAQKIIYFIKNPRKAKLKIESAYEWVKSQNWDNAVRMYLELWEVKKDQ